MNDDDLPLPPEGGAGFFPDAAAVDEPLESAPQADVASSAAVQEEGTPYQVLARKYRPRTFDDLIGQESLVRILRRAFAVGRVAHAFMLTGVRGVGKTTTARIIARALNCTGVDGQGGPTADPCGVCPNCKAILADRHPDVLEMDAASRTGVDDVREIIEASRFRPMQARMKVFVIDEVHMLSRNAFNALLKTLEEPPAQVTFIFATTELRKVPVTVLSRCQRFDLQRVSQSMLTQHFAGIAQKEGAELEEGALALIARAADGSVRDGLSLLDQAIAQGASDTASVADMLGLADRGMVFDLLEAALHGQVATVLEIAGQAHARGADLGILLTDLMDVLHLLSRIKALPALREGQELPEMERERGGVIVDHVGVSVLGRAWQLLLKGLAEVEMAPDRRQAAEMVLIRLCHASMLPTPDKLIRQLQGESSPAAANPGSGLPASSSGQGGTSDTPSAGGRASASSQTSPQTPASSPGQTSVQASAPAQGRGAEASSSGDLQAGRAGSSTGQAQPGSTAASPLGSTQSGAIPQAASSRKGHSAAYGGRISGGASVISERSASDAQGENAQNGGAHAPDTGSADLVASQGDDGREQRGSTVLKTQQNADEGQELPPSRALRLVRENGAPVPSSSPASLQTGPDGAGEDELSSSGEVIMPRSWREMVALVREQREGTLHGTLRHLGHVVEFAPPRLVLRIDEADAALRRQSFRKLSAVLDRLHPDYWEVVASEEPGEPTLDEQGAEIVALHMEKARQHPLVQAIFRHFPKAQLGELRDEKLDDYGLPPEEPLIALGEDAPPDYGFLPDGASYDDAGYDDIGYPDEDAFY